MNSSSSLYRRHRFPGEIISHGIWLYYRFSLSYRDIEELMAQRGVRTSYETNRQWCLKFRQTIVDELRRRVPNADAPDNRGERELLVAGLAPSMPRIAFLWADSAYDGEKLRRWCTEHTGWRLEVVRRSAESSSFAKTAGRARLEACTN